MYDVVTPKFSESYEAINSELGERFDGNILNMKILLRFLQIIPPYFETNTSKYSSCSKDSKILRYSFPWRLSE